MDSERKEEKHGTCAIAYVKFRSSSDVLVMASQNSISELAKIVYVTLISAKLSSCCCCCYSCSYVVWLCREAFPPALAAASVGVKTMEAKMVRLVFSSAPFGAELVIPG